MNITERGLSLIELMVVVSIIAILSALLYANFNEGGEQARDAERKADLRTIQSALELYKNRYGRYPAGCNSAGTWSGQVGTAYTCASGSQYITALAPEFLPVLPTDPKLNGSQSGYVYTTNTAGTVYKLMVKNTVESETIDYTHEFRSCDATNSATGACDSTHPTNNKPNWCQESNTQFQTTYGVWGGYDATPDVVLSERRTEDIICDLQ